jgi:hypothetical protein
MVRQKEKSKKYKPTSEITTNRIAINDAKSEATGETPKGPNGGSFPFSVSIVRSNSRCGGKLEALVSEKTSAKS